MPRFRVFLTLLLLVIGSFNIIESTYRACYRDESDHLANNLAQVFINPTKYLKGPNCVQKGPKKSFVVVGAGMAGLTSAYLLLKAGHSVKLIEASDRIGGRIHTLYGEGWYAEIGAMRIPRKHHIIHAMMSFLNIELTRFNHLHTTDSSYLWINKKYYKSSDLGLNPSNSSQDDQKLQELYKLFDVQGPKRNDGKFKNFNKIWKSMMKDLDLQLRCRDDRSYGGFVREQLRKRGLDEKLMNFYGIVLLRRAFYSNSFVEFVLDDNQKFHEPIHHKYNGFVEVVNGTQRIPNALFRIIEQYQETNFEIIRNAKVTKLEDKGSLVEVTLKMKDDKKVKVERADEAIVTTTARAASLIKFSPPLPFMKNHALNTLEYVGSVKIFLVFKKAFWASENKLPIIPYNGYGRQNGATAVSEDHLRHTYYPANEDHGPVILVSYTWNHDAELWMSLTNAQCIDKALEMIIERHGEVARKEFKTGIVKKWGNDEFSHGGFVMRDPFNTIDFMRFLQQPHGRISFAGEYTNKFHNGWIESAVESAIRNIIRMMPEEYDKHFGEEEAERFGQLYRNEKTPTLSEDYEESNRKMSKTSDASGSKQKERKPQMNKQKRSKKTYLVNMKNKHYLMN